VRIGLTEASEKTAGANLGRNRLLSALPAADFSLLDPYLTDFELAPGAVIHEAGDRMEHVYFIHGGLVSLLLPMPGSPAVEIATVGREGAIGAMAALGSPVASSRAVAQLPVGAARIDTGRLAEIVCRSKAVNDMIVAYGDALMAQVQQLAACNALHEVQARLSRWLLHAEDRVGSPLPVTQELLSQLLGVQRTTVTMVCRTLQLEGIIHIGRGMIEIRNADALERKACCCYRLMRKATDRAVACAGDAANHGGAAAHAFEPR
jgi:CRP-like cAMP-binding protein